MPRRASSGIHLGQILGIGGAIVGFAVAAVLLVKVIGGDFLGGGKTGGNSGGTGNRSFAKASELQIDTYIDNGNSLRGNLYKVSGKIEEILKYTPDRGRLVTLATSSGDGAILPVLVPETFSGVNIDRGSDFTFVVRVDRGGILIAEQIDQS